MRSSQLLQTKMHPFNLVRIVGFSLFLNAAVAILSKSLSYNPCWPNKKYTLSTLQFNTGDCVQTEVFDGCAAPLLGACWFIAGDDFSLIGLRLEGRKGKKATVRKWTQERLANYPNVKAKVIPLDSSKSTVKAKMPEDSYKITNGVMLALRMVVDEPFYYNSQSCNGRHYVDFWIYGKTFGKTLNPQYQPMDKFCPLASRTGLGMRTTPLVLMDSRNTVYKSNFNTLKTIDFKAGDYVQTEVFDGCAAPYESNTCWFIATYDDSLVGLKLEGRYQKATVRKWRLEDLRKYINILAWIERGPIEKVYISYHEDKKSQLTLGIMLALRMVDQSYYYNGKTCNGRHYVDFWIRGSTIPEYENPRYTHIDDFCPLNRPIYSITEAEPFMLRNQRFESYEVLPKTLSTLKFKMGDCVQTEVFDQCAAFIGTDTCWFIAIDELTIVGLRLEGGDNGKATVRKWRLGVSPEMSDVIAWIKPLDPSVQNVNIFKEIQNEKEVGEKKPFGLGKTLAMRMVGLTYHYNEVSCNGRHYVEYWIHGESDSQYYMMNDFCPLRAAITSRVSDPNFELMNKLKEFSPLRSLSEMNDLY